MMVLYRVYAIYDFITPSSYGAQARVVAVFAAAAAATATATASQMRALTRLAARGNFVSPAYTVKSRECEFIVSYFMFGQDLFPRPYETVWWRAFAWQADLNGGHKLWAELRIKYTEYLSKKKEVRDTCNRQPSF